MNLCAQFAEGSIACVVASFRTMLSIAGFVREIPWQHRGRTVRFHIRRPGGLHFDLSKHPPTSRKVLVSHLGEGLRM